jgi:hypothetical protein
MANAPSGSKNWSLEVSSGQITPTSGTTSSNAFTFSYTPTPGDSTGTLTVYFAATAETKTVTFGLPSLVQVTQSTVDGTTNVGVASTQTATLGGAVAASKLTKTDLVVYLNTTSASVSNCTVSSYVPETGLVTFTATPSVVGWNILYVKVAGLSPVLSYVGPTGKGAYLDYRVPTIQTQVNQNILQLHLYATESRNWFGVQNVTRIGIFKTLADANSGSNDLAADKLGFKSGASWTTVDTTSPKMDGGTKGPHVQEYDGNRKSFEPNTSWSIIPTNTAMQGAEFVRINMKEFFYVIAPDGWNWVFGADPDAALSLRLVLKLPSINTDGELVFTNYGLGFSYQGSARCTSTSTCVGTSGLLLAKNGVFRLIRLSDSFPWNSENTMLWDNPYTLSMDASPI